MTQTSHPSLETTSQPVGELLRFFEAHAAELRFPDVTAEVLSQAMSEVEARREAVFQAAEALAEAREALVLMEQKLVELARKGHAYASVFAGDQPELQEELAAIKMNAGPARKRRPLPAKKASKARGARAASGQASDKSQDQEREGDPAAEVDIQQELGPEIAAE